MNFLKQEIAFSKMAIKAKTRSVLSDYFLAAYRNNKQVDLQTDFTQNYLAAPDVFQLANHGRHVDGLEIEPDISRIMISPH